jgi:hypothetical protein
MVDFFEDVDKGETTLSILGVAIIALVVAWLLWQIYKGLSGVSSMVTGITQAPTKALRAVFPSTMTPKETSQFTTNLNLMNTYGTKNAEIKINDAGTIQNTGNTALDNPEATAYLQFQGVM